MPYRRLLVATVLLLVVACSERGNDARARPSGHEYMDTTSGVGLNLPSIWRGRYRVTDSMLKPVPGLQRELSFRFMRHDSTVVSAPAMFVLRVFSTNAWAAMPPDTAEARFGVRVANDDQRTVVIAPATGNPFAPDAPDATVFDEMMVSLLQRPLRVKLRRDTLRAGRGPGGSGSVSP